MKATTAALLLFTVALCADDKIAIDLSLVNRLPSVRAQAIATNALTDTDSTPEIGRKREAYFLALRAMAEDLRSHYYQHDEFPCDVFVGIDERVGVLVASQYPMSPTTGASYVGFLRDSFRVQLAEETVCTMVEAILSRAGDLDVEIEGKGVESFAGWMSRWEKAGENEKGPNQALQTTPMTRSEIWEDYRVRTFPAGCLSFIVGLCRLRQGHESIQGIASSAAFRFRSARPPTGSTAIVAWFHISTSHLIFGQTGSSVLLPAFHARIMGSTWVGTSSIGPRERSIDSERHHLIPKIGRVIQFDRSGSEPPNQPNQALQTTPMTRSVFEKTIEFGHPQRGV